MIKLGSSQEKSAKQTNSKQRETNKKLVEIKKNKNGKLKKKTNQRVTGVWELSKILSG
jgi:hypothetical protein